MSTRKERATTQNMKITYYEEESESNFKVGILGSRKVPYILHFHPANISCNCPDFERRGLICKHIYFVIHLARNYMIFNAVQELRDLKTEEKIKTIRNNLVDMIDKKKLENNNSESNTISIERDDCCPICCSDLEGRIEKCGQCHHCFHYLCLDSWWTLGSRYETIRGKCPYCRQENGLSHVDGVVETDPWAAFSFKDKKCAEEGDSVAGAVDSAIEEIAAISLN